MREVIGMEVPLSSDHYGHISVNSCIKLARAMEKHNLAWMEDMVPWQFGELMKQIRDNTTVPILTGEDIYLKEEFIKLIDMGAVDMIHPDLASSGGLLETKKIGDYAMEHGVRDGDALRRLADLRSWRTCTAPPRPRTSSRSSTTRSTCRGGRIWSPARSRSSRRASPSSPDLPGLGVELNPEVVKAHLRPGQRLLRADAAVGQGTLERSAVELGALVQLSEARQLHAPPVKGRAQAPTRPV